MANALINLGPGSEVVLPADLTSINTAIAGKQDSLSQTQLDNIAAVPDKASKVIGATNGNLASLDANGNLADSGVAASDIAPLASPAFTGTPTAPTPTAGDDSTKVATTAFVKGEIGGKANSAAIAPEFSSSSTYAVGDVVMYGGLRYKCSTAVSTAGEWNSANWTLESVQMALGNITPGPGNTKANSTAIAPVFDNTSAYTAGKYVTYNGNCYYAVVDVSAPASGSTNPTPDQDIYDDTTTPATGHWELKDINSRLVPIEVLLGVEAALSVINSGTEQIETLDERLTAAETAIYNILHGASN